jgi:hypothetical protein
MIQSGYGRNGSVSSHCQVKFAERPLFDFVTGRNQH